MPRFSANLNMLFLEVPYMERFAQARAAGFTAGGEEFREGVRRAIAPARRLDCRLLTGRAGGRDGAIPYEEQWACLVDNVRAAARLLETAGLTLMVEPINTFDLPKFFLSRSAEVIRLLDEVGAPNVRLQYDVYHMQRAEGNIIATLRALLSRIGHVQIADPPGRHQPGTGELNFATILRALDDGGRQGRAGLGRKARRAAPQA